MRLNKNHWRKMPFVWEIIGHPLRPNAEDLGFLQQEILPKIKLNSSEFKRVIILGVTPEFPELPWGENTEIIAIDNSSEMIRNVWETRYHNKQNCQAFLADWTNIPLKNNSCDVVLGDGCFTLLKYPETYHQVLQEIQRILKPEGLLSMRFFLRPSQAEQITTIFEELEKGIITNFHLFKWRLAMALQKSAEEGISVNYVYQVWRQNISSPEKLLVKLGWSLDLLRTINVYENSATIYTFPTLEEVRKLLDFYFVELSCNVPTYQAGVLFPTIIFKSNKQFE